MIGSIRGKVLERLNLSSLLVETCGIGYVVNVTPAKLAELEPGSETFLFIHHHVREDGQSLYGFTDRDERKCFEILISTHGVGPTLAMTILATHSPHALVDIVAGGDISALTLVSGIGKKTAERLLVELKSRLQLGVLDSHLPGATSSIGEVREALLGLGYSSDEARDAIRNVNTNSDSETLLRQALSYLGASRAG